MIYHSSNLLRLKKMMGTDNPNIQAKEKFDFEDHKKAKVLAILLANAELATPELTRNTVEGLLNGSVLWPKEDGTKETIGTNIDLALLEELGLISFNGDMCKTHYDHVRGEERLHEQAFGFYRSFRIISYIRWGSEGFIKPHYQIDVDIAVKCVKNIANKLYLKGLEELFFQSDVYQISVPNDDIAKLVSIYLWIEMKKILSQDEVFLSWLKVSRVSSGWMLSPEMSLLERSDRQLFSKAATDFIINDKESKKSWDTLLNQYDSSAHFSYYLETSSNQLKEVEKESGIIKDRDEFIQILKSQYNKNRRDFISYIDLACWFSRTHNRYWMVGSNIYTCLIRIVIENEIHIDKNSISGCGLLDELVLASEHKNAIQVSLYYSLLNEAAEEAYILFLLSRKVTASVAMLTVFTNIYRFSDVNTVECKNDRDYRFFWEIFCEEFVLVVFKESEDNEVSNFVEMIIFMARYVIEDSESKRNAVQLSCFEILLSKLSSNNTSVIATELLNAINLNNDNEKYILPLWKFYMLFWLLEKSQSCGVLSGSDFERDVQLSIANVYKTSFCNVIDSDSGFQSCDFIDTLPWHRFSCSGGVDTILDVVSNPVHWINKINDKGNKYVYSNQRLLKSYFQFILCLLDTSISESCRVKIFRKILLVIQVLGFISNDDGGESEENSYFSLFSSRMYHVDDYSAWKGFVRKLNGFDDDFFSHFIDLIKKKLSINEILFLYKTTSKRSRKDKVLELIKGEEFKSYSLSGLYELEEGIELACNTSQYPLAVSLLSEGIRFIDQRFSNAKNDQYIKQLQEKWHVYEYKVKVVDHFENKDIPLNEKIDLLGEIENPFQEGISKHHKFNSYYTDCERFKRFYLAEKVLDEDPDKAFRIFEELYKESPIQYYASALFAGKLNFLDKTNAASNLYEVAISEYLGLFSDVPVIELKTHDIQNIFHVYLKVKDYEKINSLWMQFTREQKNQMHISCMYAKSLKEQGEARRALKVIDSFKSYHEVKLEDEEFLALEAEIDHLVIDDDSSSSVMAMDRMLLSKQRTDEELIKDYQEIRSRPLSTKINVINGRNISIENFLYENIVCICKVLLERSKNLQIQSERNKEQGLIRKLTKEDLINDWFNSLFNQRMLSVGLSCIDCRGGKSASGLGVGERDGMITDQDNNPHAMMEAFRLNSNSTNVIFDHLNKIAGYDPNACSPVIILVYCHASSFSSLASKYKANIADKSYTGFDAHSLEGNLISEPISDPHLIVFRDVRYIRGKEIIFFHFLVDLNVSE